ncbi:NUDIX hydrolase [Olsenella sp. YH-ols2217]|uniref:NUDIX hydrolase n=1 Tax=Kribbibacterium absianum TaxID=3044210 RepID=A0ABT6ZJM9_9ACTN|nr:MULTISPECIES: NUDIX hydrolase [unclassified Olsenella]MDJ1122757.1 NUDIX hydrolase [Olsenella sp. YH-ols2216]MDJ1129260.1 NUDIX hydrolase [Olsenella sp. YH-ols2217]
MADQDDVTYTAEDDFVSPDNDDTRPVGPRSRHLVLGGDDPRDQLLEEKFLAEDIEYQGRILNVSAVQLELPNGHQTVHDIVRHPGAAAVVALTNDGQVCVVRQYRTALGRVTVEIPAGKLDPGEDPLECVRRELREETGMEAENIAQLTSIVTSCGFCDEIIHIFMATGLTFAAAHPDEDEFLFVDLVPTGELIDAVLDGRIEDAKTVVGALALDAIARRLGPVE